MNIIELETFLKTRPIRSRIVFTVNSEHKIFSDYYAKIYCDLPQKDRSMILQKCGYRADHHVARCWIRMGETPFAGRYLVKKFSDRMIIGEIIKLLDISREYKTREISVLMRQSVRYKNVSDAMKMAQFTFNAKSRTWKYTGGPYGND